MKHYNLITKVTELCASNYDLKTFNHCLRVANYVVNNVCLENDESRETAYIIALCHDLLEDTEVSIDEIVKATGYSKGFLSNVLCALTREKDEAYKNYIIRLKANSSVYPYIVKLADMKDHLTQKETLTDRLKEKYWEALPYLL